MVTDFQGIQWTVADAWTALQAASLARDDAAVAHARGEDIALRTTTAKKLAITAAEQASDAAYSLVGGHGLYFDTPYTDIVNDIKVLKVAGGSAEIMRNYIARRVLKDPGHEGLRMSRPISPTRSSPRPQRPDLRLGTVDDQVALGRRARLRRRPRARAARPRVGAGRAGRARRADVHRLRDHLAGLRARRAAGRAGQPDLPGRARRAHARTAGARAGARPGRDRRRRGERSAHARTACPGWTPTGSTSSSYMHTSGTTGLPKFCAQTHDYFARLAAAMAGALDLTAADRVLAPLPLFHINPMGYGIITALLTGADALTVGRFSASGFWPAVVAERVTVLILHAPPVEILKRATTAADAAGHRVRTMFYADREFLHRFGIPAAVSGYGSTEAGGVSPPAPLEPGDRRHPRRRQPARRRRPRRHRVAPGRATASILVREREHAALFDGYVTAAGLDPARDADGWFDTGDLGRADGAGPPGVPRARRRVDPGQGRVRPDPVRREPPRRASRARRPRDLEAHGRARRRRGRALRRRRPAAAGRAARAHRRPAGVHAARPPSRGSPRCRATPPPARCSAGCSPTHAGRWSGSS